VAIHGDRVTLRAVEREDAPRLHRWLNEPRVMAGWGAPDHAISRAETQRRIEEFLAAESALGRPVCLIVETLDGEAIGQVVLSREQADARSVELSLMIGEPDFWGRGHGTDALRTAFGACFDAWNLHRVWLRTEASNDRAHRLYRRCGLTHEGTLREAAYLDGRYEDVLVFALLRREWAAMTQR
jgi:RimJ/RimL family protein N-acetyltransferase